VNAGGALLTVCWAEAFPAVIKNENAIANFRKQNLFI